MRKPSNRFREITRNGSGVVSHDFTKTSGRVCATTAVAHLFLLAAGCIGPDFLTEKVEYEVQIRGMFGGFVEGAKVVAMPLTWADRRTVEGRTDSRGRCSLETRQACAFQSSERGVVWLRLQVEAEGFDSLVLDLDRSQFVDDGGRLRRVEAVTLRKRLP